MTRTEHLFGIFGGTQRHFRNSPFDGARLTALVGSCVLDLGHARMGADAAAAVDVFGLLAEVKVIVPSGWQVVMEATSILGEIEDHRDSGTDAPPAAPRLIVRGTIVLGQLTIEEA